jgi:hypothetical protein
MVASSPVGFLSIRILQDRPISHRKLANVIYAYEGVVEKSASSGTLEDNPTTSPENNSSVILQAEHSGESYLFTADAGAQALEKARFWHSLKECRWMQIPHHGSRRNITTKRPRQ